MGIVHANLHEVSLDIVIYVGLAAETILRLGRIVLGQRPFVLPLIVTLDNLFGIEILDRAPESVELKAVGADGQTSDGKIFTINVMPTFLRTHIADIFLGCG